jgi:two-component system sensor histidine kinase KdpD
MLFDAHVLIRQGADLVIGYFESHNRPDTLALADGIEQVPRRVIEYRERKFEELDTDAVLKRKPAICMVDELAHTNVPGTERPKRWEDVLVLLDAGIEVWTTMNVQHMESLNDQVLETTGVLVRETVPDWLVKQAAEVVLVDVTPEALLNRLRRGQVYTPEMARRALEGFFKESNLRALRELAMREAAHEVDMRQQAYDDCARLQTPAAMPASGEEAQHGRRKERILIHMTSDPVTAALIRRGRRVADYLRGDCLAVYVHQEPDFENLPKEEREGIEKHLHFAQNLQIETRILSGQNVAEAIVEFAHRNEVTQILIARTQPSLWRRFLGGEFMQELVRLARDMQVIIVANRGRA